MTTFTTNELSQKIGIAVSTINYWTRSGAPHTKNGHIRSFDSNELSEWLTKTKKNPKYSFIINGNPETDGDSDVSPEGVAFPIDGSDNIEDILSRLRVVEAYAFSNYSNNAGAEKAFWAKEHRDASEQLRKYEKDWALIQQSMGSVIAKVDHDSMIKDMCMDVRNALLNLADKCAPLVAGKGVKACKRVLHKEVIDCMRSLSE